MLEKLGCDTHAAQLTQDYATWAKALEIQQLADRGLTGSDPSCTKLLGKAARPQFADIPVRMNDDGGGALV